MDIYLSYIVGFMITSFWLDVWFSSTLFLHVFSLFTDRINNASTFEDLTDFIYEKNEFFGELVSCGYCLGFWTSLIVSTSISLTLTMGYKYVIVSAMTWPFIYGRFLFNK